MSAVSPPSNPHPPPPPAYCGPADVLMSHSWSNSFGDLVVCAAQGAPYGRFVWICALANRQWRSHPLPVCPSHTVGPLHPFSCTLPSPRSFAHISSSLFRRPGNDADIDFKSIVHRCKGGRINTPSPSLPVCSDIRSINLHHYCRCHCRQPHDL